MLRVVEPATEEVLAELPHAGVEETDAAVARAKAAFAEWRAVTPPDRAKIMRRIASTLAEHVEEAARLETRNVGKPTGESPGVGERLAEHPDVAKIAFTGSTAVGRRVGELAAQSIKRVTLELGGKSANIVFADADLEAAAASAPMAVFGNAGQDCCARSRILVERSAVDRFLELLSESVSALRVGDPLDDATEMGPLISADQREKVSSYLDDAAPIAIQGNAPDGPGYWFPPTVLAPVSNDDRAAREEIFGPIAAVIPFEDEADAIRIANDTPYGLSGSIWTENGARALRVARGLETGVLSVNANTSVRVQTPFGGFKQSGFGRELGMHALEGYSEVKNVFIAT